MKHKIIKCKRCKKNLPLYEVVCECGTFTTEYVPTPPADGSAFYWRHVGTKSECQGRDENNRKLSKVGAFKLTIKAFSKAIAIDAEVDDYFNRGITYGCIKEFGKAIKDIEKCVELDPKNKSYRGLLMMVKAEAEFYKKHLRIKPIVHAMMKKQKIKIKDLETDDANDKIFSFTDKKGKKVRYNVTGDQLATYDGESWC